MGWFNRQRRAILPRRSADTLPVDEGTGDPSPDHAWKALSTTNEWIRHADAKTGITLAFAGVTFAALFNVAHATQRWTCLITVLALVNAGALLGAVLCAGMALLPRVAAKETRGRHSESASTDDVVNLLFFGDVSKHYGADSPTYRNVLSTLTSDVSHLTCQIADQVHANAHVATAKFQWANRAVVCELTAAVALVATAFLNITGW